MTVSLAHRILVASLATLVVTAGCGSPATGPTADPPAAGPEPALGHVHGLGVDPADGTLYVASHTGVYRFHEEDNLERVADRYQDTMGFAVVGPGHFLASGHPDAREQLPAQLGLVQSTDAAKTWTSLSLSGQADLHAIEVSGNRTYAYDSNTGAFLVSSNRIDWEELDNRPLLDIAVDPDDPDRVFATSPRGELLRSVHGANLETVDRSPVVGPLDWQPGGPLVGIGPEGAVMISNDAAVTWTRAATLDGQVQALEATEGQLLAATDQGIFRSVDRGNSWSMILRLSSPH